MITQEERATLHKAKMRLYEAEYVLKEAWLIREDYPERLRLAEAWHDQVKNDFDRLALHYGF